YVSSSMIMSFLGKEYALEDAVHSSFLSPNYTIKVTGNQWYWTYEYGPLSPEGQGFAFDSYTSTSYDGLALKGDRVGVTTTSLPSTINPAIAVAGTVMTQPAGLVWATVHAEVTTNAQHHLEAAEW